MSTLIRPYGDTTGDGMVQMSFTLPVPHDKRAEGAALQLARPFGGHDDEAIGALLPVVRQGAVRVVAGCFVSHYFRYLKLEMCPISAGSALRFCSAAPARRE